MTAEELARLLHVHPKTVALAAAEAGARPSPKTMEEFRIERPPPVGSA